MLFQTLALLDDPEPHSAALNMAIDEALLRTVQSPVLRCYRWERPAVSFGYFGRHAEVEAAWPDRDMVRRWTGGGVVPHGEDFTYSLIVPQAHPLSQLSAGESYHAIHEAILRALGASIRGVAISPQSAERISDACFENAVRHDLVVDGRKVAGAAQRRTRYGLLHQGSIQVAPSPLPPGFDDELAMAFAGLIEPACLSLVTMQEAAELARERYAAPTWLRRR